jgi:2-haloacid dehalogenase
MSRWVTFDCYGTLADWRGGIRNSIEPLAGPRTDELLQAYFEAELEVEHERPEERYREILAESLRRAAARTGVELPPGSDHVLSERWAEMPIFEDTAPVLTRLRDEGWSLAILTNCDDDLIARTIDVIGVDIDLVITANSAGSYKPAHGHFNLFADRTEHGRELWIHAANSWIHDITPARELGLECVWVDRDRTGQQPDEHTHRIDDLRPLPAVLATRSGEPL